MDKKIRINIDKLPVRMGPSRKYDQNSEVQRGMIFTIIDEKDGYGLLKSRSGWVELKWCEVIK